MQGNQDAFEVLFRRHYVGLCRYAQTYLELQAEAEDVVQEVFIRFWNRRATLNIHSGVRTYLYASVKHGVLDVLKHRAVQRSHSLRLREFLEYISHTEYSDDEEKQLEQIRAAFRTLPEQCRTVFLMNCLEGKKYAAIAEELNISVNTVKSHMLKAYRTIREKVGKSPWILFIFLAHRLYASSGRRATHRK